MAASKRVHGFEGPSDRPSKIVFRSDMLGMDNRRAQKHILDSLIKRQGKGVPDGLDLLDASDEEDVVYFDLGIRRKLEYVRERLDKADEAESMSIDLEGGRTDSPPAKRPDTSWKIAFDPKQLSSSNAWEPPSPAKSTQSSRDEGLCNKEAEAAVGPWLDDPFSPGGGSIQTPSTEDRRERSVSGEEKECALNTVTRAGLDARALVLLWFRGVLGPMPGGDGYPSLLTVDQLDTEVLSTRLEPKEATSLLYDIQARFGWRLPGKELGLRQCRVCEEFKIFVCDSSRELEVFNEFPLWKTKARCSHKVCTTCTVKSILGAFDDAIWMESAGIKFYCSVAGCSKYLGQFPKGRGPPSFSILLPLTDQLFMGSCYQTLVDIKKMLKQELPHLAPESRAMGEQTAATLRKGGYMMTIAEASNNPRLLQLGGAGTITSMSASSDSTYEIPVLAKLLKREVKAKRCSSCRLAIHEVYIQDQREWRKTMAQCIGKKSRAQAAWGLHLLNFPLAFGEGCAGHPFVCVKCLRILVGSYAPGVEWPAGVACPSRGCWRVLGDEEVACLVLGARGRG